MKKMINSEFFCNSNNWPGRLNKIKQIHNKVIKKIKIYFNKKESYYFNFIYTNNYEVKKLSNKYKNKKKSTDVLTFVSQMNNKKFSKMKFCDIFFSFDTLKKDAIKNKSDFYDHYTHILIHSLLHIIGFSHANLSNFKKMKKMEIKILNSLGIQNPYLK